MKRTIQLLIGLSSLFLFGCSIPKATHQSATQFVQRIDRYKESVEEQRAKLNGIVEANTFLSQSKDQLAAWDGHYNRMSNQLNSIASSFSTRVTPLLEKNDRKDDFTVRSTLTVLSQELAQTIQSLPVPVMEAKFIIEIQASTDEWLTKSQELLEGCDRHTIRLDDTAIKYKELYPHRINDIDKRVAETIAIKIKASNLRKGAVGELGKASSEIDWAIVANNLKGSLEQGDLFLAKNEETISDIRSLDLSYTKILEDMRIDYFVQIYRSSWDNGSDSDTTKNSSFPMVKVSREQYETMIGAQYPLASVYYSYSWGSGEWKTQGYSGIYQIINPRASWPNKYHDYAEFWVEDSEQTYWHQYTIIENGKETKTDWIEVDEEEYLDYSGALGMSIESKPYGSFPNEAIEEPHPPAFAFVDNEKYGRWKKDDQGNEFWEFYTNYMMLNLLLGNNYGGYRYYHNDYNSWRSSGYNRPYYGRTATSFGTKSAQVQNSSRYRSSTYARSGSFKNPPTAIRGSGPSRRGGGPSSGK